MAVTLNARGTSFGSFRIGKGGPTITADADGYLTIADGVGTEQPIGYNTIPIYEIDANDTFDLAHAGMMWHKDSGAAVTFTCDNDSTIPQGSTWIVHNDDAEDITIAEGTGVTIAFLASGAAPVTGNVTVAQGGIVTVYKYTNTEYWVWGDEAPFDILTAGATTDSTLRWSGTAWTEETQVTISAAGVLTVLDSTLADSIAISHDGTDVNIANTGTTDINVTGLTGNLWLQDGAGLQISDSTDADTATFSHDGADFNLDFTNTANWNISGNTATYFASGANTQSIFGVGNIGLQGNNSDGILRLFGEQTSVVYGAEWKVEASYGLFQGTTVGGVTAIATTAFDVDLHIWNGNHLRIYDATQTDYVQFEHDGTNFKLVGTTTDAIAIENSTLMIEESAAATADVANYGQIWVKNDAPNNLYFTDDAGNDYALTGPEAPIADSATLQTTNATQTEILAYSVASGTSVGFEALIMGREDATGDTVLEKIRGLISNEAGTTALIDTPGVDRHESAGATAWVVTVAADDTGDTLTFDVTGEAAHTIDWKIKLEVIVI